MKCLTSLGAVIVAFHGSPGEHFLKLRHFDAFNLDSLLFKCLSPAVRGLFY